MIVLIKKTILFFVLATLVLSLSIFGSYIDSFSAAVNAWNRSNINDALSLLNLSMSSTINVANASSLWYFSARLDIMDGKMKDAGTALQNAVSIFGPAKNYPLLDSLMDASMTSFIPIVSLKNVNSIQGVYNGNEIFYSPVSASIRKGAFYILDAANRDVLEFGKIQNTFMLDVNSTPTAIVYSALKDSFYISFENGDIYIYNSDFTQKKLFASNLSYPVIFCTDMAGRVYAGEYGEDSVVIFENDGKEFKKFSLFVHKVHIFSYGHVSDGILYLMDLTDKVIRRFDIISGQELSSVPFPNGPLPFDFELAGTNIIFLSSQNANAGGVSFSLDNSKSLFSSVLSGTTLVTTDPFNNKVNIYNLSLGSDPVFPIIDSFKFEGGKTIVLFRLFDLLGGMIEYPSNVVVSSDGFLVPFSLSYTAQKVAFYEFPKISDIFDMNKNFKNVVVINKDQLSSMIDYFGSIILNNISLYVIGNPSDLSEKERMMVQLTGGSYITNSEIPELKSFVENAHFEEFVASYPTPFSTNQLNDISLSYGASSKMIDTVYYTDQNIVSK